MATSNRNPNTKTQVYYDSKDYDQIMEKLPALIDTAKRRAIEIMEPNLAERQRVRAVILDFVRTKERKMYGGTALNECIMTIDPKDRFYDDVVFSDLEFYSPEADLDVVELCNILHKGGFAYVKAREAQHDETYSIFVNFQLYCDITYMPAKIYANVRVIKIGDINYVHPHFIYIDYLRIINSPLTMAEQRWEKIFKRSYLLLRYFPLELFLGELKINTQTETAAIVNEIRNRLLTDKDFYEVSLITGYLAYNFFVKHAVREAHSRQKGRQSQGINIVRFRCENPFVEVMSINYQRSIQTAYDFLIENVPDASQLSMREYFPFFQFMGRLTVFLYRDQPILKIFDTHDTCIPNISTNVNYMYVSYQYLLMYFMMMRFRAFVDELHTEYTNYRILTSNLIQVRNWYLETFKKGPINNSVFGEFRIGCFGSTTSSFRLSQFRSIEKGKRGKNPIYTYYPDRHYTEVSDVKKFIFSNSSGNLIVPEHKRTFHIVDGKISFERLKPTEAETVDEDIDATIKQNKNSPTNPRGKSDSDVEQEAEQEAELDLNFALKN